jgi:4-carboxymuconolactone decarboxylase
MATQSTLQFRLTRLAVAAIVLLNVPAAAHEQLRTVSLPAATTPVSATTHRSPSVLEAARMESSALSDIVEEFAARDLGEETLSDSLDERTRELVSAAAYAAMGNIEATKLHAANALRYGATNGALREILYLTAVHAGAPKAIAATQALEELLAD